MTHPTDTAKSEELKSCPFCGGSAAHVEYDEAQPFEPFGLIVDHKEGCFLDYKRGFDDTIPAWNRRSSPPQNDAGVEGLREAAAIAVAKIEMDREGYPLSRSQEEIYEDAYETVDAVLAALRTPMSKLQALGQEFDEEREINFEVWEDDMIVASSTDEADARHYLAVYSQDGPVRLVRAETVRTTLPSVPSGEGSDHD